MINDIIFKLEDYINENTNRRLFLEKLLNGIYFQIRNRALLRFGIRL